MIDFEKMKSFWEALPATTRRRIVLLSIGMLVIGVSLGGYVAKDKTIISRDISRKTVSLEPDLLKQSTTMESQKEISRRDEKLAELQKQLEELAKTGKMPPGMAPPAATADADGKSIPSLPPGMLPKVDGKNTTGIPGGPSQAGVPQQSTQGQKGTQAGKHAPGTIPPLPPGLLPPPPGGSMVSTGPDGQIVQVAPAYTEMEVGDIAVVSGEKETHAAANADKKKEVEKSVFLPPSFMPATLLSGLDAPTSEGGKGRPVPVLIRISAPAILPNETRASLKGCFILADGIGNLGTERAELTLVSLTCLDRRGNALINQKIKGFVVDADGKIALRGKVVAKMGSMIARSMMAGFLGGVGEAMKAASTTTSISPLGNLQSVKPGDLAMAGAGGGLANAFQDMQKFYMTLANATLPVIEVGATKPITVVISEGVELKVRKLRGGNR